VDVVVPDLGDFADVEVIEVLVKPGDAVAAEQGLITLETEKATIDIPSPAAGRVSAVTVKSSRRTWPLQPYRPQPPIRDPRKTAPFSNRESRRPPLRRRPRRVSLRCRNSATSQPSRSSKCS
jgi:hypothetical protein